MTDDSFIRYCTQTSQTRDQKIPQKSFRLTQFMYVVPQCTKIRVVCWYQYFHNIIWYFVCQCVYDTTLQYFEKLYSSSSIIRSQIFDNLHNIIYDNQTTFSISTKANNKLGQPMTPYNSLHCCFPTYFPTYIFSHQLIQQFLITTMILTIAALNIINATQQ